VLPLLKSSPGLAAGCDSRNFCARYPDLKSAGHPSHAGAGYGMARRKHARTGSIFGRPMCRARWACSDFTDMKQACVSRGRSALEASAVSLRLAYPALGSPCRAGGGELCGAGRRLAGMPSGLLGGVPAETRTDSRLGAFKNMASPGRFLTDRMDAACVTITACAIAHDQRCGHENGAIRRPSMAILGSGRFGRCADHAWIARLRGLEAYRPLHR